LQKLVAHQAFLLQKALIPSNVKYLLQIAFLIIAHTCSVLLQIAL